MTTQVVVYSGRRITVAKVASDCPSKKRLRREVARLCSYNGTPNRLMSSAADEEIFRTILLDHLVDVACEYRAGSPRSD